MNTSPRQGVFLLLVVITALAPEARARAQERAPFVEAAEAERVARIARSLELRVPDVSRFYIGGVGTLVLGGLAVAAGQFVFESGGSVGAAVALWGVGGLTTLTGLALIAGARVRTRRVEMVLGLRERNSWRRSRRLRIAGWVMAGLTVVVVGATLLATRGFECNESCDSSGAEFLVAPILVSLLGVPGLALAITGHAIKPGARGRLRFSVSSAPGGAALSVRF